MLENKQEDPMIKLVIRSDGQENRGRSSGKGKKSKKRSGLAHNMWYCGSCCGCGLKKVVL